MQIFRKGRRVKVEFKKQLKLIKIEVYGRGRKGGGGFTTSHHAPEQEIPQKESPAPRHGGKTKKGKVSKVREGGTFPNIHDVNRAQASGSLDGRCYRSRARRRPS